MTCRPAIWLLFLLSCTASKKESCPEGQGFSMTPINGEDLALKQVALTFDDGPASGTARLLDFLKSKEIAATFFIIANRLAGNESLVARIQSEGHLIGNHTYTHSNLTETRDVVAEVRKADELISPYITGNMFLFRAPYGAFDGNIAARLNSAGISKYVGTIDWDIGDSGSDQYTSDTECWARGLTEMECAEIYLKEIRFREKGIILFHDSYDKTVAMIEIIIPQLIAEGYSFVRLDEVPNIKQRLLAHGAAPGSNNHSTSCWDY